MHARSVKPAKTSTALSSLKVTNPERVVDPSTQLTKIDVVRYYSLVAPLMLEHIKGRPVSLVRAPDGISGQLFFQKHWEKENMKGVEQLDPALDPDHPPLLEISTANGLVSAAQMNVVEFHTWNAKKRRYQQTRQNDIRSGSGRGGAMGVDSGIGATGFYLSQ